MKHWLFLAIVPYWIVNTNAKLPAGCVCELVDTGKYRPKHDKCPAFVVQCIDPANPPAGKTFYKPRD